MDFVRKITNSDAPRHIVDLPESLHNQDVELIMLPLNDETLVNQIPPRTYSVRGALGQYANPDLLQQEQEAWKEGVREKYEHC